MTEALIGEEADRHEKRQMLAEVLSEWSKIADTKLEQALSVDEGASRCRLVTKNSFYLCALVYPSGWCAPDLGDRWAPRKTQQRIFDKLGDVPPDTLVVPMHQNFESYIHPSLASFGKTPAREEVNQAMALLADYLSHKGIPCESILAKEEDETPFIVFQLDKATKTDLQQSLKAIWDEHVRPHKKSEMDWLVSVTMNKAAAELLNRLNQKDPFGRSIANESDIEKALSSLVEGASSWADETNNRKPLHRALKDGVFGLELKDHTLG